MDAGNLGVIGVAGEEVFPCPTCARPLARGAGRCPSCGTRLMLGVEMRRAGIFLLMGAAIGLIIGGLMAATIITTRLAAAGGFGGGAGGGAALASPGAGATPAPSPAASPGNQVPASVASALRQATIVNDRLNRNVEELRTQLGGSFDPVIVADTLRQMAVAANDGSALTARLATWGPSTGLANELQSAYDATRTIARDALSASLTNSAAYRIAATRMIGALKNFSRASLRVENLAAYASETAQPAP